MTRESLQQLGLTREMACGWRDFYAKALADNPGWPQFQARLEMFERALKLLCE